MSSVMSQIKIAWSDLATFQKWLLVGFFIVMPIGMIYPPALELLMVPMSFISCPVN